jgi:hypothetical protein
MSRISDKPPATIAADAMTDDNLDSLIGAIIQYPLAGRLPDHVVNGLCYWRLVRRGIVKPSYRD